MVVFEDSLLIHPFLKCFSYFFIISKENVMVVFEDSIPLLDETSNLSNMAFKLKGYTPVA